MQIPHLGPKQSQAEMSEPQQQPKEQKPKQTEQQIEKELVHGGSILQGPQQKHKKILQQV